MLLKTFFGYFLYVLFSFIKSLDFKHIRLLKVNYKLLLIFDPILHAKLNKNL